MARKGERPWHHPDAIRELVTAGLEPGETEPIRIGDLTQARLRLILGALHGTRALVPAAESLLALADELEQVHHSPDCAAELAAFLETPEILRTVQAHLAGKAEDLPPPAPRSAPLPERLIAAAVVRGVLSAPDREVEARPSPRTGPVDATPKGVAPRINERPPEGSIKLGSLTFPKKL